MPETDFTLKALDELQTVMAQAGDRQAFSLLMRRHYPRLLRFAYRQIQNPDAAQDVMQDAALAMAKNINRLKDPAQFTPWAYTIVRRRAADHIKRAVKQRQVKNALTDRPRAPSGLAPEDAMSLKQGLSTLPDADRLLLKLFYLDGLTGTDIAAALDLPLGTVKSRLFSAREKLRAAFAPTSIGENYY